MEGQRYNISTPVLFSLVWIGFLGAISVAYSLFLLRISNLQPQKNPVTPYVSLTTVISLILATVSIFITPYTLHTQYFTLNLAFVHIILLVPILTIPRKNRMDEKKQMQNGLKYTILLLGFSAIVGLYHLNLTFTIYDSIPNITLEKMFQGLLMTIFSNECQVSISTDLVGTTLLSCIYILTYQHPYSSIWTRLLFVFLYLSMSVLLSIGSVFPLFMIIKEVSWWKVNKVIKNKVQ